MPEKIQRSFTSGEISPALQSRADLIKYGTGLNLCENFFVKAQGGVYTRPGFRFIGELDDSSKKGRLIPFSFNTEQTYMLVFEDLILRIIKDGGFVLKPAATITNVTQGSPAVVTTSAAHTFVTGEQVTITGVVGMTELNGNTYTITVTGGSTFSLDGVDSTGFGAYVSGGSAQSDGIYEVVTTYTEAELPRLDYTQSADVMTIVHPNHDPANLSRTADNAWTLSTISYAPTVTAPTISSVVAGGTGAGSNNRTYTYVVTAVVDGVESLASASSSLTTPSLSTTAYARITWGSITGAEYYRIYKDPSNGTDFYGWIGDSKNLTFDDFNFAPITSDAPPADRQPFTGTGNKPSAVNYYQQRQVFASTTNEPQAVYTTQTGNFNSLRTSNPARADDAVTFTIAAQQVNEIRYIISLDALILLTSGGEWKTTEGQDGVLTPSTLGVRIQSYNGSALVKPVVINTTALYVQKNGTKIRDLAYEFSSDRYTGNDLSLMSDHLFKGYQITELAYAEEPYGILWCVRDDGTLLGLTYQREHQVFGWHHHTTDGEFESIAIINENDRDALYAIVKRTIGAQTRRYVERLDPREETLAEDCFYVDSGLSYDGSPATVFTGLDHLEGKSVVALADGNFVEGLTVSSGSVTLGTAASKVHIGLAYTPVIELLDIDVAAASDGLKAEAVSVSKVILEVENSRGGFVAPRPDLVSGQTATAYEIKPRYDSDAYDTIPLRTFKQDVMIDPQWNKGGGIRIEQRAPLPMGILSVTPRIDVGGS